MQSPVAILQKQRQYRASSYSNGNPPWGSGGSNSNNTTSGTTPSSFSSSFIDHAFDHPTPTSFSQLQLLSSSLTSNDGADYTHRVPKVEQQFCSGFNCCGLELDDLHHLLEHFEECHVLPGGSSSSGGPATVAAALAAASGSKPGRGPNGTRANRSDSQSSSQNDQDHDNEHDHEHDMPQFDDFDDGASTSHNADLPSGLSAASAATSGAVGGAANANASNAGLNAAAASSGTGPTLSAPPSPAMSSYSDHHPVPGTGPGSNNMYDLKTKRSHHSSNSQSSFGNFNASQSSLSKPSGSSSRNSSRSPPSDYDDSHSMHSEDDTNGGGAGQLAFARRHRQQSVDSLASVSTNASTSSKKRNFNTALGSGANNSNNANSNNANLSNLSIGMNFPASMHTANNSSTMGGINPNLTNANATGTMDFSALRAQRSGFSTPDSSVPGTPNSALEHEGIEMPGVGCLPPSLLFPLRHTNGQYANPYSSAEEDMSTTDEDDDGDADDVSFASGTEDDEEMDENVRYQHLLLQQQMMLYGNANNNGGNGNNGMQNNNNGNGNFNPQAMQQLMTQMNMTPQQQQQQFMLMMMQQQQNMNGFNGQQQQHQGSNNGNNMMMNFGGNGNNKDQNAAFANMLGTTPTAEPSFKKKKTGAGSNGNKLPTNTKKSKKQYDPSIDRAAAAMFSPLSLQGQGNAMGGNIPMPTVSASTSPSSQATASAATLAAIQAAAAANQFPDSSTPTGRVWIPNNAKPFKCPVPGCDKAYKQQNGLKYHRLHGHCNANGGNGPTDGAPEEDSNEKEEDKPFGCYVGPACGKKYKNMNGLRYHYQHSGAHGQIGLQMLTNGTHPPPAYPPGHKRAGLKSYGAEFSANPSPTVVMNQSTAEALLAAISQTHGGPLPSNATASSSQPGSRGNSRPATPGSRNLSPQRKSPLGQEA